MSSQAPRGSLDTDLVAAAEAALEELGRCADLRYGDVRASRFEVLSWSSRPGGDLAREHVTGVGVVVRALRGGPWGIATTQRLEADPAVATARRATVGAGVEGAPVALAEREPERGRYATAVDVDPFALDPDRPRADLADCLAALGETDGLDLVWNRATEVYLDTAGARLEQRVLVGGPILRIGGAGRDPALRQTLGGAGWGAGGYEIIAPAPLTERAAALRQRADELASAPPCPSTAPAVILDAATVAVLLRDTVPRFDADRAAAGDPAALRPATQGRARFSAAHLDLVADARAAGMAGTFGWDAEGVPAHATPLVSRGVFVGYLSSRHSAAALALGRAAGCVRGAPGQAAEIGPTNLLLAAPAGAPSLEELVADTPDGLLVEGGACWEIRGGLRTRLLRGASVAPDAAASAWARCDALCGPGEARRFGSGGGAPSGTVAVPARFRNLMIAPR